MKRIPVVLLIVALLLTVSASAVFAGDVPQKPVDGVVDGKCKVWVGDKWGGMYETPDWKWIVDKKGAGILKCIFKLPKEIKPPVSPIKEPINPCLTPAGETSDANVKIDQYGMGVLTCKK